MARKAIWHRIGRMLITGVFWTSRRLSRQGLIVNSRQVWSTSMVATTRMGRNDHNDLFPFVEGENRDISLLLENDLQQKCTAFVGQS